MTRTVIYVRVSRDHQEEDGSSLETQEARCRAYATERGYHVTGLYTDTHTGSEYRERPGLSVLRDEVRAGHVDAVICYAVDRLSRNQAHLYIIAEEIDDHGGRLEFVTEDFEDSAVGRFIRSARAFAAEVEREKITERTTRGRKARVEAGKLIPNGRPLYGYQWADAEHTRLEIDPLTSQIVRRIYAAALAGTSLRQIVVDLYRDGIPSPSGKASWSLQTVSRILRHPNYTGTAYGWWQRPATNTQVFKTDIAIPLPAGTVPAIVSRAEWDAVQEQLRDNKRFAARNNGNPESALLRAGIARCGYCGGVLVANVHHNSGPRYQCNYRGMRPNSEHRNVTISIPALDAAVWERITAYLLHPETVSEGTEMLDTLDDATFALTGIERALSDIERRIANLTQAIELADDVTALVTTLNRTTERKRQLEDDERRLLRQIGEREQASAQVRQVREWGQRVAANIDRMTYQQRRDLLLLLNTRVTVFATDAPRRFVLTADVPLDDGLDGAIVSR